MNCAQCGARLRTRVQAVEHDEAFAGSMEAEVACPRGCEDPTGGSGQRLGTVEDVRDDGSVRVRLGG